jgi:hypothetical protein
MGHAHGHGHPEDASSYYLEQLCTIGISAAVGGVCIVMYQQSLGKDQVDSMLGLILKPVFHWPVLAAGIVLVGFAAIRAIALWFEVGRRAPAHAHSHGPDCCHEHDHAHSHDHGPHCHGPHDEHVTAAPNPAQKALGPGCAHDHGHEHGSDCNHEHQHGHSLPDDHGHEHGWNPWRYAVLLLPITLFFLNLPNGAFGVEHLMRTSSQVELTDNGFLDLKPRGDGVLTLGFKELEQAAYLPDHRRDLEGKTGMLKGQFVPGKTPNTCKLVRLKMTCCAADAIALDVRIISRDPLTDIKAGQWVEVTGQIQFRKVEGVDEYKPVLQVQSRKDIVEIPPETNPYLP